MLPELLWAQRSNATEPEKNLIYLTVKVPDLQDEHVNLTPTTFEFKGKSKGEDYAIHFEWYDEVDVKNSKQTKTGQGLLLVIRKKNPQEEYWPRLTNDKARRPYLHTDFDKWVDEDEQEALPEEPEGMEGMMPGMGGAGAGAGGMPGMGGEGGDMSAQMAQLQALLAGQGGADGSGFDMSSLLGGQGAPDDAGADIEKADEEEPKEEEENSGPTLTEIN